ncbi:MAG: hypothetical protein ACRYG4_08760 [Janthinobacterium lividum]
MNMMTNFNATTALAAGTAISSFDAALLAYEAAEAHTYRVSDDPGTSEADADAASVRRCTAWDVVLRTPADSYPALARKAALFAQEVIDNASEDWWGQAILADVARLAAPSPARAAVIEAAQDLEATRQAVEAMPWETPEEEAAGDAAVDVLWDKRRAFMVAPAPDFASLVDKLRELSHPDMKGCIDEVAEFSSLILADAERLSGVAHLPASDRRADRSTWDDLYADYLKADAEDDRHYEEVYTPLSDAFDAAKERHPEYSIAFAQEDGDVAPLVLKTSGLLQFKKETLGDTDFANQVREHLATADAIDARNAAKWSAMGGDAVEAEGERLNDLAYDLRNRLIETPAPDLAAFAVKYELLRSAELLHEDCASVLTDDLRRLQGVA